MAWAIGRSLPMGYAAISIAAPRRRRSNNLIWALATLPALATGVLFWATR
jgi:hypothetical protein